MIVFLSLFLAAALTAVDQLLKVLVVAKLQPVGSVTAIDGLLTWLYSENTGAAFGMMTDCRWVFIVITAVLMAGCLYALIARFRRNGFAAFVIALILAGGAGNMIDRVLNGYVVDYIYVSFFPAIFNFADCCVVVGAILALIGLFIAEARIRRAEKAAEADAQSQAQADAIVPESQPDVTGNAPSAQPEHPDKP